MITERSQRLLKVCGPIRFSRTTTRAVVQLWSCRQALPGRDPYLMPHASTVPHARGYR